MKLRCVVEERRRTVGCDELDAESLQLGEANLLDH